MESKNKTGNRDIVNEELFSLIKIKNYSSISDEADSCKERIKKNIFSRINTTDKSSIQEQASNSRVVLYRVKYYMIAASIVMLLSLTSIIYFYCNYEILKLDKIAKVEVISPKGAITSIYLPDSTLVTLNSNSKLIYPILFTDENKIIELEGEAYFDVKKQKNSAMIVKSGLLNTYVLGTKFNVKSYPEDEKIELTLIEGVVMGEILRNSDNSQKINLLPNQQLIIDKEGIDFSRVHVDAIEYTLWMDGSLALKYVNLQQVKNILERKFKVLITIDSDCINLNDKYLANFDQALSVDEILDLLSYKRNWCYVKQNCSYHIQLK